MEMFVKIFYVILLTNFVHTEATDRQNIIYEKCRGPGKKYFQLKESLTKFQTSGKKR